MKLVVTCPAGTESLVALELRELGLSAETAPGALTLDATLEDAYRIGIWSRVASRVLIRLAEMDAPDPDALYDGLREIAWEEHLGPDETLAVHCAASRERRDDHTRFLAQKAKDAIVDRIRDLEGRRPNVDRHDPDVRVHLRWADPCTVSIDLHGALHRRGYRERDAPAPLRENLAAAVLMLSGWTPGDVLLDPMCGSGTLLVEAGWMVRDVAPGLGRSLGGWKGHQRDAWERLLREAKVRAHASAGKPLMLHGSDSDSRAVQSARKSLERASLMVPVRVVDALEVAPPAPEGTIVVNPPYGERLGTSSELAVLYGRFGDALKARFGGWSAHVLAPPELISAIGLKPKRKHVVYNGPLECRLASFDIEARARNVDASAEPWRKDSQPFANRLRKNLGKVRKWAERSNIEAYRIYDADIPEFNVAIDVLGDEVMVAEYSRPKRIDAKRANARLQEIMRIVPVVLERDPSRVHLRVRARKGGGQYEKRDVRGERSSVREGPFSFLVNTSDYLDVGLFPDHRKLRVAAARECGDGTFLNLFAYTCTASVVAAASGATTTSVDLSRTYLDWGADNFAHNEIDPSAHRFERAEAQLFLGQTRNEWDVTFLNPPSFSRSKAMRGDFVLERDHAKLIRAAMKVTRRVLFFSTHARGFRLDAAIERELNVRSISKQVVPRDYLRSPFLAWRITRP